MLTEIEIDDELIAEIGRRTGLTTEAAVDAALKLLLRLERQKDILELAGRVHWDCPDTD